MRGKIEFERAKRRSWFGVSCGSSPAKAPATWSTSSAWIGTSFMTRTVPAASSAVGAGAAAGDFPQAARHARTGNGSRAIILPRAAGERAGGPTRSSRGRFSLSIELDPDLRALDADGVALDRFRGRGPERRAGLQVELPSVPGADDAGS